MAPSRLAIPVLLLLTFAAFFRVGQCGFVDYDDTLYVTQNPYVQHGLSAAGVHWALTTTYTGYWHPLTWLSLMLDAQVHGAGNAAAFHFTNLLLHAANTLLVFLILRGLTGDVWRSLVVAAIFGVHPLRVESVAWIAERKDVLSSLFGLLAIWAYVSYVRRGGPGWYAGSLALFLLSLCAKPMLVTLPAVLLLLDYWPACRWRAGPAAPGTTITPGAQTPAVAPAVRRRHSAMWLITEKLPFFAAAAAVAAFTVHAQAREHALASLQGHALAMRLSNAVISYARYLGKMAWFGNLAVCYPFPDHWAGWQVGGATALLVAITALALWRVRRWPWLPVGWFWFVGMLLPVIGLVQVGEQSMADRYAYLPTLGLLIGVVWSIPDRLVSRPAGRVALGLGTGAVMLTLCVFTWLQVGIWKNSRTLFSHAVHVTDRNFRARSGLALALSEEGEDRAALDQYRRALEIRPRDALTLNNVGNLLADQGQYAAATDFLQRALVADPDYAEAHSNLGNLLASSGKMSEAIAHFRRATQLDPFLAAAFNNLGLALAQQRQTAEAVESFRRAVALRPELIDMRYNLGVALLEAGNPAEAASCFEATLAQKPDMPQAHFNLGRALGAMGRYGEAIPHFEQALALSPNDAEFQRRLEEARRHQGEMPASR